MPATDRHAYGRTLSDRMNAIAAIASNPDQRMSVIVSVTGTTRTVTSC